MYKWVLNLMKAMLLMCVFLSVLGLGEAPIISVSEECLYSDLIENRQNLGPVDVDKLLESPLYEELKLKDDGRCYFFYNKRYWLSYPLQTSAALFYESVEGGFELDTVVSVYPDFKFLNEEASNDYFVSESEVTDGTTIRSIVQISEYDENWYGEKFFIEGFNSSPEIARITAYRDHEKGLWELQGELMVDETEIISCDWELGKLKSCELLNRKGVFDEINGELDLIYTDSTYTVFF